MVDQEFNRALVTLVLSIAVSAVLLYWVVRMAVTHAIRATREPAPSVDGTGSGAA